MSQAGNYGGYWERPEWIYNEVQKIDKYVKTPEMVALKARSVALFSQHVAGRFPDMFNHYTKIFFRAMNQNLNGPMFLMLLKQKSKIDRGEVPYMEGNQEVIGGAFQLLMRKLPEDLQEKVLKTYNELVDEEKQEMREAIRQKLEEQGEVVNPDDVQSILENVSSGAPQRIEMIENDSDSLIK
jgi:hypothetical protein